MNIQKLKDRFNSQSSNTKTMIIGTAGVVTLFAVVGFLSDDSKPNGVRSDTPVQHLVIGNPNANTKSVDTVGTELSITSKKVDDQQRGYEENKKKIEMLETQNQQLQKLTAGADGHWSEISNLVAQVQVLQEKVNSMSNTPIRQAGVANEAPVLSAPLPTPSASSPQVATEPAPAPRIIQVVGDTGEKKSAIRAAKLAEKPPAYIPSGSNFEGVLLNGMDASTAIGANRTPAPALLRIKSDAILPNMFSFNVRECFVLVGGFGNISSERVEMRTETMSCISEDGTVWEGKVEGYLVGEDGKVGARGRVVSKQGALLAKSFMAGFVGGIGGAFSPQPVSALNLTGGSSSTAYQYPALEQVVGSGVSQGLNKSATALAQFYIKLAEQMFPVIELDANRKMTIILIKGVDLKMEKKTNG